MSIEPQDQPLIKCGQCGLRFVISQRFVREIAKAVKRIEKKVNKRKRRRLNNDNFTISIPLIQTDDVEIVEPMIT